jgi:hypothetical protein
MIFYELAICLHSLLRSIRKNRCGDYLVSSKAASILRYYYLVQNGYAFPDFDD